MIYPCTHTYTHPHICTHICTHAHTHTHTTPNRLHLMQGCTLCKAAPYARLLLVYLGLLCKLHCCCLYIVVCLLFTYSTNTQIPSWKPYLLVVSECVSSLELVLVVGGAYPWGRPLLRHLLRLVGGHDACAPWSVTLSLSCTP